MAWSRKKTAVTAAALLAAVYAGGAAYFQNHTFPNTILDGKNASMVTDAAALSQVKEDVKTGVIQITAAGREFTLDDAEVLSVADEAAVQNAVSGSRNVLAWPAEFFRQHVIDSGRGLSFDREKAAASLESQGLLSLDIAPVDAVMSEFSEDTGYTVLPDQDGWKADREALLDRIEKEAVAGNQAVDLTEEFAVKAAVSADDPALNETCEELNSLVHYHFAVHAGDETQELTGEMLNSWLTENRDGVPGLDAVQLKAYAESLQERFGDKLGALQEENGQRYIVDHELFLDILASRMEIEIPKEETSAEAYSRTSKNEKIQKQAEKDAKKAATEEEKEQILAEAEAKLIPAPEMIALKITKKTEPVTDTEENPAESAAPSNAETATPSSAKSEAAQEGSTGSAKEEKESEEAAEDLHERYLHVVLTKGLFIENPLQTEQEEQTETVQKEAKQKETDQKQAEQAGTLASGSDAERVAAGEADEAQEKTESETEPAAAVSEELLLAEDEIHLPLLEASPEFQLGYGLNYIDVDIERQHVILFENARKVMESDCVTGTPIPSRTTHKGVFQVEYKQRNRILRGSQRLYASFVNYWMPFDGGIGLHDATWRSSFGGTIYKTSGSHGCVNLPLSFVKNFYPRVYPGETVYVH